MKFKSWCRAAFALLSISAAVAGEYSIYPEGGFRSRWLWIAKEGVSDLKLDKSWKGVDFENNSTRYFRKVIVLDEEPMGGEYKIITDDSGTLHINGKACKQLPLDQPGVTIPTRAYSLDGMLHKGKNVLSIAVGNGLSEAGFIITGEICFADGKVVDLLTDSSWKCHKTSEPGWESVDFDDSAWQPVVDLGDATITPWRNLSNAELHFMTRAERANFDAAKATATDISFLAKENPTRARLATHGMQTGLLIGGKPVAPIICILNNTTPWNENAARMVVNFRNADVNIVEWGINFLSMMKPDGSYDFSQYDQNVRRILTLNPDAKIILRTRFERSPGWWEKANPDELIEYATGGEYQAEQAYRFRSASMASEAWRAKMRDTLAHFMEYVKSQPWSKRVIGVRVSYGVYSEWHYYGMESDMPDTGKAMTRAFRKYLAERYGTDAALQKAWDNTHITLATAAVPGVQERKGRGLYLREGIADRAVLDYYDCHCNVVADTMLMLAETVKAADDELLTGAYYGYTFGMPYGPEAQTLALDKVLASPYVDFLSQPYIYLDQRRKGGDGLMRALPALFREHKKLFFLEDDTRTHLAKAPHYTDAKTPDESVAILRRNLSAAFLEGGGIQFLEFGSGSGQTNWYDDPVLMKQIRRGGEIWRDMFAHPQKSDAKIAVIFDPSELMRSGYPTAPGTFTDALGNLSMLALHQSGFVFDLITPEEFAASANAYELAVFLNFFSAPQKVVAKVAKRLEAPALKRIYWIYAPGLASGDQFSDEAMSKLSGITLKHDLAAGKAQVFSGQSSFGVRSGSGYLLLAPRVYADDPKASVSWQYDTGQAAAVRKTLPNGKLAYFFGIPITDPAMWKALFADARIHSYTNPGTVVRANHSTIMYHSADGKLTAALPRSSSRVVELFDNKEIGRNMSVFKLDEKKPFTWLLRME